MKKLELLLVTLHFEFVNYLTSSSQKPIRAVKLFDDSSSSASFNIEVVDQLLICNFRNYFRSFNVCVEHANNFIASINRLHQSDYGVYSFVTPYGSGKK